MEGSINNPSFPLTLPHLTRHKEFTVTAPWITYRPELKILDCTVRDGGLINDHMFEDGLVKAVYDTCVEAGVDYMELGYKASKKLFGQDEFGDWKFCDEDAIRRIEFTVAVGIEVPRATTEDADFFAAVPIEIANNRNVNHIRLPEFYDKCAEIIIVTLKPSGAQAQDEPSIADVVYRFSHMGQQ